MSITHYVTRLEFQQAIKRPSFTLNAYVVTCLQATFEPASKLYTPVSQI